MYIDLNPMVSFVVLTSYSRFARAVVCRGVCRKAPTLRHAECEIDQLTWVELLVGRAPLTNLVSFQASFGVVGHKLYPLLQSGQLYFLCWQKLEQRSG